MKLKKFKFISLTTLLIMIFIISLGVSAMAYEPYNSEVNGSITVNLKDIGTPRDKVKLTLYKIGDVEAGSNPKFILKEEYKNSQVDLNSITSSRDEIDAIEKLQQYLEKSSDYRDSITDSNGVAMWSDLPQGAYLIVAKNSVEYGKISPSLIYVPCMEENSSKWMYDIKMYPKAEKPDTPEPNPPHDEDFPSPPDSPDDDTVKTGDDTDYTPYILIGIFAVIGIIAIVSIKSNSKQE